MKGFCSVLLPPFANVSGQIVNRLPVLTPLCYGYIHTATGARLARKKETAECGEWQYVRSVTRAVSSTAG
uniref:Uncharacterized protein n=1 Tax=Ixodes scapularis TaxID=6945 RepID=A0A4D5S4Q2_IXOSC